MEPTKTSLPENAYRSLKPGEEYMPIVPAEKPLPEVTLWSLLWGLFFSALFSMAAAYLGLKIGQVFEAAIPIAILAVGLSVFTKRKNALSENVIIQSIGAASGVVVAGAIFTIPAIYILDLDAKFFQIFLASLFGGFLGILFMIPFRKYFVKEMHGQFPFPEATATTEVLVAGESGGEQAKILLKAMLIGGIYDFIIGTFHWWAEVFSSRAIPFMRGLADDVQSQVGRSDRQVSAQNVARGNDVVLIGGNAQPRELGGISPARFQGLVADEEQAFAASSQFGNALHRAGQGFLAQINRAVQIENDAVDVVCVHNHSLSIANLVTIALLHQKHLPLHAEHLLARALRDQRVEIRRLLLGP